MKWNTLNLAEQLNSIDTESQNLPILIFKHSTRCSISSTALSRLERKWQDNDNLKLKPYYLDLLEHRIISNTIAQRYQIEHQSPQVLIINQGKCIYSATHLDIFYDELMAGNYRSL
jgi:bacillithiol system protein YtxJ